MDTDRHIAPFSGLGRASPCILRVDSALPSAWSEGLERAVGSGFDTMLLPAGPMPRGLAAKAAAAGVALLGDVFVDRAMAAELDGAVPFRRLNAGNTDPRTAPMAAEVAALAIGTAEDVAALAAWWGARILAMREAGFTGVRLLGLRSLPGWGLAQFLEGVRAACPGVVLFGWTPGVPWDVLQDLAPGTLDLVASSMPWWDGEAGWFWRETAMLRDVAPVVCDAGAHGDRAALAAILGDGWMTTADDTAAKALNAAKRGELSGLSFARLVSPPDGATLAVLRTDAADPRQARRGAVCVAGMRAGPGLAASGVLAELGAEYAPFACVAGEGTLRPGAMLAVAPGGFAVHVAEVRPALWP